LYIGNIYGAPVDGTPGSFLPVFVDSNGKLGTLPIPVGAPISKDAHQAMLNHKVEEQQATIELTVAQQQKQMEIFAAQLKEQAAQIQKVSAQLEVSKPAPQIVVNKP
jgi:hypothetical protein